MSEKLITVKRSLLQIEHQRLRAHIPETNRLGDLSIKWHRFGEAALTYIERGQYQRAAQKQYGKLQTNDIATIENKLNHEVLPAMPHGNDRITAPVVDVKFMGYGRYSSIAYMLDSDALIEQWRHLTSSLDSLNGVNSEWDDFEPHVSIATIESINESVEVLDTFYNFSPENFTLLKAVAKAL